LKLAGPLEVSRFNPFLKSTINRFKERAGFVTPSLRLPELDPSTQGEYTKIKTRAGKR
jgi:hypothetical protein